MEDGVTTLPKLRPRIGAVDVDDDIRRIQQNDQVLCEIGQRIHLEILIRQQDRSGFGDAAGSAHHGVIDIRQRPGIGDRGKIEFAADLRRRRTDEPAMFEQAPDACPNVACGDPA